MNAITGVKANPMPSNSILEQTSSTSRKELKQEDFMKLLLTQLKLQNPAKPYDSSEMLQQMSQMTTLSSTQSLEKTIKQLNASLADSQIMQAAQLVGRNVQVASDISPLRSNGGLSGSVVLPQAMDGITIAIKNNAGQLVKTIGFDRTAAGILEFSWDGKNDEGQAMSPGAYEITALGRSHGKTVSLATSAITKVNSIALDREHNQVVLDLDGLGKTDMEHVIKIL